MWKRKELKKRGKSVCKKHLVSMAAVCLVMAFLAGEYGGIPEIFTAYDDTKEIEETVESNHQKRDNAEVVQDIIGDGEETERKEGQYTISPAPEETKEAASTPAAKYTRGVFSSIFNNVTNWGSFVLGLIDTVNQGLFKGRFMAGTVMSAGLLVSAGFYIFVQNILRVGECRFFLECLTYRDTRMNRLLLVYHVRRTMKVAKAMLLRKIYQFLWDLTMVGGWIKHYSYLMVPYLLAENPELEAKEAIQISRRMMHGYKWKVFLLDVSFFWWYVLGIFSFGLSNIIFLNPYKSTTYAAVYMQLRQIQLQQTPEMVKVFNDIYLDCPPKWVDEGDISYPYQLFTIPEQERRQWLKVDFRRDYSVRSYILLFFTFSAIGWLWEVMLHLVDDGVLVNRGVLYGPWLPIYGSGGVLVLLLLKRVRENVPLTFFLTVGICGTVEYFTSWFLEVTKHLKWWDYSGYFLNLNGRICAEGLLVFGLGGCAFIYFAAPLLDDCYKKISAGVQKKLCICLICIFVIDFTYSHFYPNTGKGITDYKQADQTAVVCMAERE